MNVDFFSLRLKSTFIFLTEVFDRHITCSRVSNTSPCNQSAVSGSLPVKNRLPLQREKCLTCHPESGHRSHCGRAGASARHQDAYRAAPPGEPAQQAPDQLLQHLRLHRERPKKTQRASGSSSSRSGRTSIPGCESALLFALDAYSDVHPALVLKQQRFDTLPPMCNER